MPKPSDYLLSDAENAAIFEQYIRPAELGDPPPVAPAPDAAADDARPRPPVCIILAGQTGAGKSHAAPAFVRALTRAAAAAGPPVHLVADTHKPYHPAYAALLADAAAGRCPPGLPSAATGPDARRWLARACAAAAASPGPSGDGRGAQRQQRRPVLVESASRYPADVAALAGVFRRGGFRVCIVLVAAHAVQSRLGLLARFLDGKAAEADSVAETVTTATTTTTPKPKLPVRLTPRPIHDESYDGLAQLAAWLDGTDSDGSAGAGDQLPPLRPVVGDDDAAAAQPPPPPPPPVDAVLVLRRGNRVALARYWDAAAQQWTTTAAGPASVARALDAERQRLPPAERAQFDADVARLRARYPARAGELDALAAEAAADDAAGGAADTADLAELDADALVARLQADDW